MSPKSAHSGFTKENWYFLLPLLEFLNIVLWPPKKKVVGDSSSSSSSSSSSILVRCAHHSVLILLPCKVVCHENNDSCPANHYRLKSWLVLRGCLSSFFSPPPIRDTAQIQPPWPKFSSKTNSDLQATCHDILSRYSRCGCLQWNGYFVEECCSLPL